MSTAARVATNREVNAGTWAGHLIRKARKAGRCEYWLPGRCRNTINVGDYYLAGELNGEAGGYGQARYCMDCAGPEARAVLANDQVAT